VASVGEFTDWERNADILILNLEQNDAPESAVSDPCATPDRSELDRNHGQRLIEIEYRLDPATET
jgi:hypothetical protein